MRQWYILCRRSRVGKHVGQAKVLPACHAYRSNLSVETIECVSGVHDERAFRGTFVPLSIHVVDSCMMYLLLLLLISMIIFKRRAIMIGLFGSEVQSIKARSIVF